MPFSVLIVVEKFIYGGVETSIVNEVDQLTKQGVDVHLAVGNEWESAIIPGHLVSFTPDLNFRPSCSVADFLKSVDVLRDIIQKNKIDIVHTHPLASILAGFTAAELEKIPCVYTVHGPATLATYFGHFYNFLYISVILPSLALIYSVSEETFDLVENFVNSDQIKIINNSVEVGNVPDEVSEEKKDYWLVVSRLDELKINGILDAIRKIASYSDDPVWIAGVGSAQDELEQQLQDLGLGARIVFLGPRKDIKALMQDSIAVVGMGRVVLEGISCKRPVLLTGYDGTKGFLAPYLLKEAVRANFSGRNLPTVDIADLHKSWDLLSASILQELYNIVEENFSSEKTWKNVGQDFKSLEYKEHFSLIASLYNELKREVHIDSEQLLLSAESFDLLDRYIFSKKFYEQHVGAAYMYCRKVYNDDLVVKLKKINYVHEYKAMLCNKENERLKTKIANYSELFLRLREKISADAAQKKALQEQCKQQTDFIANMQAKNENNGNKTGPLGMRSGKNDKDLVASRKQADEGKRKSLGPEHCSVFEKIKSLLRKR